MYNRSTHLTHRALEFQKAESLLLLSMWAQDPGDKARLAFDLFSAVIMFVTGAMGAYTAKWLAGTGDASERSLSFQLGNCLSGGVMLSAGFVHLLADAIEDMGMTTYPYACLLSACGYILTLLADQFVAMHAQNCKSTFSSSSSFHSFIYILYLYLHMIERINLFYPPPVPALAGVCRTENFVTECQFFKYNFLPLHSCTRPLPG